MTVPSACEDCLTPASPSQVTAHVLIQSTLCLTQAQQEYNLLLQMWDCSYHLLMEDGSENAVWAWCQGLVFHSSDRLTDELWEAGGRLSLRVPLLWRHSWAEQDLLQTTTRETESIWFNRCPSRQAPEELAANPAMLEASSAAQPISDIIDLQEFYWDNCPNNLQAFYPNGALSEMKRTLNVKISTRREWNTRYGHP
ncbi:uncharacterized protein LOC100936428 [Pongo abelii]|uniref:uncharacterized protein LOC100936428 n=1 Tax=Pongo abelii TaxID=9601 RepID=UPI0023E77C51|nr:uncharacterized protein LOC100936428 [Pongo abelii]